MLLKSPAKINFGLWIGAAREDGYHPVQTIFLPVNICDTIEISLTGDQIISCSSDVDSVPSGEQNICWKAADRFLIKTGIKTGVEISLKKIIPSGAGLGGGSSNAAYVLKALNELTGAGLSREEMHKIAAHLGADVPFFLYGKPCSAKGIGDLLEPVEFTLDPVVVIAVPRDTRINTAAAYSVFDSSGIRPRPEPSLADAIKQLNNPDHVEGIFKNDFEQILFPGYPELKEIKSALRKYGATYASLSGSGSAVYGFFNSDKDADAAQSFLTGTCMVFKTRIIL